MRNKKAKALRKVVKNQFQNLEETKYIFSNVTKYYFQFNDGKMERKEMVIPVAHLTEDCQRKQYKKSKHFYKLFTRNPEILRTIERKAKTQVEEKETA